MAQAHPSFAGRRCSMSSSTSPCHRPSQLPAPRKANKINKLARFYETALVLRKSGSGYPQGYAIFGPIIIPLRLCMTSTFIILMRIILICTACTACHTPQGMHHHAYARTPAHTCAHAHTKQNLCHVALQHQSLRVNPMPPKRVRTAYKRFDP